MRKHGFLHMLSTTLLALTALVLAWTASFYLTKAIYARAHWQPHELVNYLLNAALGFVIFGIFIMLIGPFVRPREYDFFIEMIEALRRISRGDFGVSLQMGQEAKSGRQREDHPYSQLVESINSMAANLKAMEELRQEFISNVSHEIGSPLTSISGFARALKNNRLEPELRDRYLTIIETECSRLSKLSDNLLKLAVLDSDRQPYHPAPYRLDQQLVSLILACEPQWEAKGIEMSVEAAEIEVIADEDLLSQVWINLIHNAIKFTPQGGSIAVTLVKKSGQAVVRITDTGPGISELDRKRIFERFFKADKARQRTEGGSGLGLSIVSKILELHRGTIGVSGQPGEGAEFTVTLPLAVEQHPTRQ